jgi:hypothetical protein
MAAKNKNIIKFGDEEISEKLLKKIREETIEEYKKDMARTKVKKEYQCSHCKILPRPGSFKIRFKEYMYCSS